MMERLTNKREAAQQRKNYEKRLEQGYPRNIPEERFLKLAYYEDMEEQGRLVVLPCKVGDTLYYAPEWYARCDYGPEPITVEEVNSYSGTVVVECYLDPDTRVSVNTWDFGKTVFLTREEAEQALKGGANCLQQPEDHFRGVTKMMGGDGHE